MAVYSLLCTLLMITPHYSTVPNLQHQHWHSECLGPVSAECWLLQGTKSVMRSAKRLCVLPWPGVLWTTAPPGPDPSICILIAVACILIITRLPPRSSAQPRTLALRGTGQQQRQVNELSYFSPLSFALCLIILHRYTLLQHSFVSSIVCHFGFPQQLRWSRDVLA